MQKLIVPDASVILKWTFSSPNEHNRDKALNILNAWISGRIEILLPKLWVFEVANVLALKNPKFAEEIMDILIGYRFPEYEANAEICKRTFELMGKYRGTFYDAVYHAVALINKGTLVTADKPYYLKSFKAGNISMLDDFSI